MLPLSFENIHNDADAIIDSIRDKVKSHVDSDICAAFEAWPIQIGRAHV